MRRVLLALALTGAILAAISAAPLFAQPTPPPQTLTGELLATGGGGENIFVTDVDCDPTGDSSFSYEATGVAGPPYVGPFRETGTVTMGPILPTGQFRRIETFTATFRIDSPAGLVIGNKFLAREQPFEHGIAECTDTPGQQALGAEKSPTILDYEADIHTATGTFRDRGTAETVVLAGHFMGFPFGGLAELFTSELQVPEPICPPQSDADNDGLSDQAEGVFGALVTDSDSDDDGVADGNEDSDDDGEDDEDEDDDEDECPDDGDGDGVEDEDEDD